MASRKRLLGLQSLYRLIASTIFLSLPSGLLGKHFGELHADGTGMDGITKIRVIVLKQSSLIFTLSILESESPSQYDLRNPRQPFPSIHLHREKREAAEEEARRQVGVRHAANQGVRVRRACLYV